MALSLYQVVVPVTDLEKAAAFYQQLFGLEGRRVAGDRHDFDLGGLSWSCRGVSAASGGSSGLYFVTEDMDGFWERAKGLGSVESDGMVTEPWGDRRFVTRDPFGNPIGFVDEQTRQHQLSERAMCGPDDLFRTGSALSLRSLREEKQPQKQVASVHKIFEDEIWLHLTEASGQAYQSAEAVRIHYWDHEGAFYSDTTVKAVASDSRFLAISIPKEAKPLQRRGAPRVLAKLPLEFSRFKSPDSKEVLGESFRSQSEDISTGGVRFILKSADKAPGQGDKLRIKLTLSPTERVTVTSKVITLRPTEKGEAEGSSVGVQFVEVNLDDQITLLQFLIDEEEKQKTAEGSGSASGSASPPRRPAGSSGVPPACVQAVPVVEAGRVHLELINGYQETVQVKNVVAIKGAGSMRPILGDSQELAPGAKQRVDVTDKLIKIFGQSEGLQEESVHILLTLEPEPPEQPSPSSYLLKLKDGKFIEAVQQVESAG